MPGAAADSRRACLTCAVKTGIIPTAQVLPAFPPAPVQKGRTGTDLTANVTVWK